VRALIGGYVLLAALAAPAALPAAEEDVTPAPVGSTGAPIEPAGTVAGPATAAAEGGATDGDVAEVATSAKQATHDVVMRDIAFVPKTITVQVGDTITWTNEDSEPHNAIANDDSFRTATIQQDETASATIDEAGTHTYFCSIHAGMKGTVTAVGGGSSGGGSGSVGGSGTGSSGTGSSGDFLGDSSTGSSTDPGTSGSSLGGSSGSPSSLPNTGRDDAVWFALLGAWLLSVGAAIRAAAAGPARP
jgi:LPXTG-motif cell wall-anchored protein